jgi:hypothetical protein
MHARRFAAGLLTCITFAACSDNSTTAPSTNDTPTLAQAHTGPLVTQLTNLAVTSTGAVGQPPAGTAGVFNGTLTITSFASNAAGQLLASGTISGVTTFVGGATQTVTNVAFSNLVVTPASQRCTILHLDLGPIFLNLLGLQLTTSPITLDLTAVAGAGNLLGNLLCAVAHLLDQNPLLPAIQNLLNQINGIISSV